MSDRAWHAASAEEVLRELDSGPDGLEPEEAARRIEEHGPNRIARGPGVSPWRILLDQFRDLLIYLLLGAAAVSLAVGLLPDVEARTMDAVLIVAIVLANGLFGFLQDYRAEKAMEALRDLATPGARVVRGGRERTVRSEDVVPGDVVALHEGDEIPADARVFQAESLETVESALTGESAQVAKSAAAVAAEAPLPERTSMVYTATSVVRGRARAVVVATGEETEVGAIAAHLREPDDDQTPFQQEVDQLGRHLGAGVVVLIALVVAIQLAATEAAPVTVLLVAVSLAVAAIPEGLPAVVTFTLALGARRMLSRNVLVRRLPVVESLGSVDVIVTDKTGTLTENEMTVERIWTRDGTWELTGGGTESAGQLRRDGESAEREGVAEVLRCGALVNDARRDEGDWHGDPTEVALRVAAAKLGIEPEGERLRVLGFSSDRKRMTVVIDGEVPTAWTKGAPEVVLERCSRILVGGEGGEEVLLDEASREEVLRRNDELARDAYRVMAFARREIRDPHADDDAIERDLVLLGLQAMIDPPREEVRSAVDDCRRAGIRVVMATGDNLETAKAIAGAIGLDADDARTGRDLDGLPEEELARTVEEVDVFARVSPDHKVRILRALQDAGHRVAMTGDGVNDAPALRHADVGVAMGLRGTDVAQEASDMVLRDDDFVSIRDAVAEGRGIFDNIRKFVNFLLSANAGEVLVVFLGVLVGSALFPERFAGSSEALILTPAMLLWVNLVTDGLPALALGVDPLSAGIMERPPRGADEPVIDRRILGSILVLGTLLAVVGLGLYFETFAGGGGIAEAQTLLFTFLVLAEMVRLQMVRARYGLSILSNRPLLWAVASSLLLQLAVLYTPLAAVFGVSAPGPAGWARIGVALLAFLALGSLGERILSRTLGHATAESVAARRNVGPG